MLCRNRSNRACIICDLLTEHLAMGMIGCSTVVSSDVYIHLFFFSTMTTIFCTHQGIVGVHRSELYVYSGYWKHDAVVPIMQDDLPVDVLTLTAESLQPQVIAFIVSESLLGRAAHCAFVRQLWPFHHLCSALSSIASCSTQQQQRSQCVRIHCVLRNPCDSSGLRPPAVIVPCSLICCVLLNLAVVI